MPVIYMVNIILLSVSIIAILIIHIIVDIRGCKPKALNKAICADCIICLIYLLSYTIWK